MERPDPEPRLTIGPRVRKSPYFEATLRHGAKSFTVYNHMYMPTDYTDPVDEYWKLVEGVTVWDVACERQIEITGPDAARFVQYLTPRNLADLRVGSGRYVVLTDQDGGIVNDAVLLRLAEQHFWLSPGDGDALLWVQGAALHSGFEAEISEPDVSPLQLQGPRSPDVARALFGDWVLDLGYDRLRETELDEIPLVVARTGWSGEVGYELYLRDGRRGDDLFERVMAAGRPWSIAPIAPSAIRSVEGGLLSYVSDIRREDDPFTVGLGRLVDLTQEADFIGKAALHRIAARGPKRRLLGVQIDGAPLPGNDAFWPVRGPDGVTGHITRCVYSPRLEQNIGFANLPAQCADVSAELIIETPAGPRRARVVPTPFVESKRKLSG